MHLKTLLTPSILKTCHPPTRPQAWAQHGHRPRDAERKERKDGGHCVEVALLHILFPEVEQDVVFLAIQSSFASVNSFHIAQIYIRSVWSYICCHLAEVSESKITTPTVHLLWLAVTLCFHTNCWIKWHVACPKLKLMLHTWKYLCESTVYSVFRYTGDQIQVLCVDQVKLR